MTGAFGAAILAPAGERLTASEKRFFAEANPFGFIVFQRNLDAADQIRALCADLRDAVGRDAPVFVDQEGGRVQRLWAPLVRDWPPPLDHVAALGTRAEEGMYLRAAIIAAELRALGIDGNCVPCLDVARLDTHPILRNRCLGQDADSVIALGRAVVNGTSDMGVLPVIKHMPGHGLGRVDSHLELPRVSEFHETLKSVDFRVFGTFADAPLGMTAHLVFDAIDDRPATISPVMIRLIRDEIGFGGLLMTDDISMQALQGSVADRGAAALRAGCDLVLHCNGDLAEMQSLMDRAGPMTDAAQARAEAALAARKPPPDVDIATLDAKLAALRSDAQA